MAADTASNASASAYEEEHVHSVYEQIAPHFSSTRYKPWPKVEQFLKDLAPGSVGLDVGCGNGKYLDVNKDIFILASDRSTNLLRIARTSHATTSPAAALVADTLALPHPSHAFDFAICIAVLHHLSTPARRVEGIRAILDTLRVSSSDPTRSASTYSNTKVKPNDDLTNSDLVNNDNDNDNENDKSNNTSTPTPRTSPHQGGKALLVVWALEQENSRRGWQAGGAQDVMVPWVTRLAKPKPKPKPKPKSKSRHHINPETTQEVSTEIKTETETTQHDRYYHLYTEGELESDVRAAGGAVVDAGYERDNWWVVVARVK